MILISWINFWTFFIEHKKTRIFTKEKFGLKFTLIWSQNNQISIFNLQAQIQCSIIDSETSETGWIGFKGPFYPYALENFGDYFTIETRYRDNDESHLGDGYWRLARVTHDLDGANMEKVFLPAQHENKLSVYDVRVNKVIQHSNDDINKVFTYHL